MAIALSPRSPEHHARRRQKAICNGNVETFKLMFSRESILLWHFKSFKSKHSRIAAWTANQSGPRVLRFRKPKDAEAWVRSLTPWTPESD